MPAAERLAFSAERLAHLDRVLREQDVSLRALVYGAMTEMRG